MNEEQNEQDEQAIDNLYREVAEKMREELRRKYPEASDGDVSEAINRAFETTTAEDMMYGNEVDGHPDLPEADDLFDSIIDYADAWLQP